MLGKSGYRIRCKVRSQDYIACIAMTSNRKYKATVLVLFEY